jgi:DNA-binding MarR family transcriptional regulator
MTPIESAPEQAWKPVRTALVDLDTGKIIEGTPLLPRVIRKHFKEDYLIMFQAKIGSVIADRTFKMEELRVFFFVVSEVAMGNWLHMTQKEVGERLGMKQANVSKAFKSLVARGLLEISAQLGRSKAYRLSPEQAWRGAGAAYTNEMKGRKKKKEKATRDYLRAVK